MKRIDYIWHLTKRTWSSYRAKPLGAEEQQEVSAILLEAERELWNVFPVEDQRHSFVVMKRFQVRLPTANHAQLRAALLHDIGKIVAPLSTTMRVIATFVGPRTATFRAYHDHEQLGLQILEGVSDAETLDLLRTLYECSDDSTSGNVDSGKEKPGNVDSGKEIVRALIEADNI
jgi:hypothetical protein